MSALSRSFYARDSVQVARDLLGKRLVRNTDGCRLSGRIVEVEAYAGEADPGSHAYRGRTRRNDVMFGPAGYLYVYRIYGMHVCTNVVTATEGVAEAVLLRALEPLEGIRVMQQRRGREDPLHLCSGPAKLCTAFGITMADNGADVVSGELWAEDDGWRPPAIGVTTRIGLRHGADLPMRFVVEGSPYLSR